MASANSLPPRFAYYLCAIAFLEPEQGEYTSRAAFVLKSYDFLTRM